MKENTQTKFIRDKLREPYYVRFGILRKERLDLLADVGVHGLVLFEYYLRIATIEGMEITDEAAAEYFNWNLHTAGRWRRALITKGWLRIETAKSNNNNKIVLYYLGKDEVQSTQLIKRKPG